MKTKTLLMVAGAGTIAYMLYKKRWLYTWMF